MVGDRISDLPDEVLFHVLSFLSTEEAVATSVLAKRWRYLWHSLSSFDIDHNCHNTPLILPNEAYLRLVKFVYNVLNSGDLHRSIQRFRLRYSSTFSDDHDFNTWINVLVNRRVEYLDLSLSMLSSVAIPSCTTLVSLKLERLHLQVPTSIEFPSLQILHLYRVSFSKHAHLAQLVSGSPVIEDLNVTDSILPYVTNEKPYESLTKLVKACISNSDIHFETVKYAQFLRIDWKDVNFDQEPANHYIKELSPIFPNLIHLDFTEKAMTRYWPELVVEILKRSPKLQFLSIDKGDYDPYKDMNWRYPQSVPECISSQLRTYCFNSYVGSECEFELARYIMENATRLQSMTIRTDPSHVNEAEKLELHKKLSMCARQSSNCELNVW